MRIRKIFLAIGLGTMVSAANATLFTLTTTIGNDSTPISATADFSWSGDTLDLTLTNTTDGISKTIQELTGFTFMLSGSPTYVSVTGLADGTANCIGIAANTPCVIDGTDVSPFGDPVDLTPHNPAPDGWAFLPGYALFTFGAGDGSFKPYGIVNGTVVGTGHPDNTSNPEHNPLLLGPVDFHFLFDGSTFDSPPTITGVQFYWGTGGDHRAGACTSECSGIPSGDQPVPEPQTLALVAMALLAMAAYRRRRGVWR